MLCSNTVIMTMQTALLVGSVWLRCFLTLSVGLCPSPYLFAERSLDAAQGAARRQPPSPEQLEAAAALLGDTVEATGGAFNAAERSLLCATAHSAH